MLAAAGIVWASSRRAGGPSVRSVSTELSAAHVADAGIAEVAPSGADALRLALEDEPPYGNDVHRAVCGKRADCRVIRNVPAGTASDGRVRELVTVAPFAANAGFMADPDRNYDDATLEHWMLWRRAGSIVERQWLVHDFDYSYSSVEGEPAKGITLSANAFRYTERWRGLSRFTGLHSSEIDLSTMHVVRTDGISFDQLEGETQSKYEHDYVSLRLRHQYLVPNCAVPPVRDAKTGDITVVRPTAFTVEWDAVPLVPGAEGLSAADSIDACSPSFDGVHAGFVRSGAAAPADASFHALLVDDAIVIDVTDDALTAADALEVWTAPDADHGLLRCEPPATPLEPAAGTNIDLATGATRSLAGKMLAGIRVSRSGEHVRVTVPLPVEHDTHGQRWPALALVLRDSDDGKTIEREITTTKGFRRKLVELADYPPSIGCARSDGKLVRKWPGDPLRPLIGAPGVIGAFVY